jgi:hypothetical protein
MICVGRNPNHGLWLPGGQPRLAHPINPSIIRNIGYVNVLSLLLQLSYHNYNNKDTMSIKKLTTFALTSLLFAGALFTTGCEKSPEDKAADAMEDAADAVKDAVN